MPYGIFTCCALNDPLADIGNSPAFSCFLQAKVSNHEPLSLSQLDETQIVDDAIRQSRKFTPHEVELYTQIMRDNMVDDSMCKLEKVLFCFLNLWVQIEVCVFAS
jgi:hypothetical protein